MNWMLVLSYPNHYAERELNGEHQKKKIFPTMKISFDYIHHAYEMIQRIIRVATGIRHKLIFSFENTIHISEIDNRSIHSNWPLNDGCVFHFDLFTRNKPTACEQFILVLCFAQTKLTIVPIILVCVHVCSLQFVGLMNFHLIVNKRKNGQKLMSVHKRFWFTCVWIV